MLRFFGNAFRTVFVAALVLLAVALAPTVGMAFAHAGAASREATLTSRSSGSLARHSRYGFSIQLVVKCTPAKRA